LKTILICIETLCGRISPAGFGSKADRMLLEEAREQTGATLLGAGSLRAGDPEFRTGGGKLPAKRIRAVITRSGNIPSERSIFKRGPKPLIFCPAGLAKDLEARFRQIARIIGIPEGPEEMLPLKEVLAHLGKLGAKTCLVEGGGRLNYEALRQEIVDELLITISPRIIGKDSEACLVSGPGALGSPFLDLDLLSCRPDARTGEIFLHYRVKKGK